jgi:hypothetical protein
MWVDDSLIAARHCSLAAPLEMNQRRRRLSLITLLLATFFLNRLSNCSGGSLGGLSADIIIFIVIS